MFARARVWGVSALLVGCGGTVSTTDAGGSRTDTGPASMAHVTASWRVRCDTLMDCSENPARTLDVDHGEGDAVVECDAPLVGAERQLRVRFEQPREFGISLSGAMTSPTGGRVSGDACSVTVLESSEMISLRGPCSANPPSVDAPCQIQRVEIDEATRDVSLELRCVGLGTIDGTGVEREVTDPDTAAGSSPSRSAAAASEAGGVDPAMAGCARPTGERRRARFALILGES